MPRYHFNVHGWKTNQWGESQKVFGSGTVVAASKTEAEAAVDQEQARRGHVIHTKSVWLADR